MQYTGTPIDKRPIYISVRSGLGNQLFQYAFGYASAMKYQRQLVLCPAYFPVGVKLWAKKLLNGINVRQFRLDKTIQGALNIIPLKEVESLENVRVISETDNLLQNKNDGYIIPQDDTVPYLFKGYWQDVQLFEDYRKDLIQLIRPVFKLSHYAREKFQSLHRANVIAIHIRRGDFLTNRSYGACELEYYLTAIEHCNKKMKVDRFLIFTDDKDWVRNKLLTEIRNAIIYDNKNENTDIEEMYIMRYCRGIILSNSTFSWWGAWLKEHNDKLIIAPSKWFKSEELCKFHSHLLLPEWEYIDNKLELKVSV